MPVEKIKLEMSKPNKDFGKGFYLSDNEMQAIEMARFKMLTFGGEAIVSKFEFDESVMTDDLLHVKIFTEYSEEWANFVFINRDNVDAEVMYDIVYGPIANDKVGLQIRKLKDGSIDRSEFLNRLKYMKGVTYQYFFGTQRAIAFLSKI